MSDRGPPPTDRGGAVAYLALIFIILGLALWALVNDGRAP